MQEITLLIVYPDADRAAALLLQESFAQKFNFMHSTLWDIEHYRDNSPCLLTEQPIIFVGGPNSNYATKDYINTGTLSVVTDTDIFIIYKSTNKYFLCGKQGTRSARLATEKFIECYANEYLDKIVLDLKNKE